MWVLRKYLDGCDLSCRVTNLSQSSIVVQDFNTTVQRIVERSVSGVINPDALRNKSLRFDDLGLPANMSIFDRLDMIRSNGARIATLSDALKQQVNNPPAVDPASPAPPTQNDAT